MKKSTIFLMVLVLVLALFVSCGQKPATSTDTPQTVDGIQTVGDAYALENAEFVSAGSSSNVYAYVFKVNGVFYRVLATLSDEIAEQYYAVDYSQENASETAEALIAGVKVDVVENLTEKIPPQEELDALAGKTGEDLLNNGWFGRSYNFESWEVEMEHGIFSFTVTFNEGGELPEDYDADEVIKPLTVKSVTFLTVADATADLVVEKN